MKEKKKMLMKEKRKKKKKEEKKITEIERPETPIGGLRAESDDKPKKRKEVRKTRNQLLEKSNILL